MQIQLYPQKNHHMPYMNWALAGLTDDYSLNTTVAYFANFCILLLYMQTFEAN